MTLDEFAKGLPAAQTKAPWQLEIDAMETIAKTVEPLDNEARTRVLRWLAERFVLEQAPAKRTDEQQWQEFIREPGKAALAGEVAS